MSAERGALLGVIGYPIGHSLSPVMHNAALAELGLPYEYRAFEVHPDRLGDAVRGAQALGIRGLNATIPHKRALIPFLDEITPRARLLASVNTLIFEAGRVRGDSTDGPGFVKSLLEDGIDPAGRRVLLLGAGGSARAVADGLIEAGASSVSLAARNPAKLRAAIRLLTSTGRSRPIEGHSIDRDSIMQSLATIDLLVNATPLGMHPDVERLPPVPLEALRPEIVVADLIYNPSETRLLAEAKARGCRTVDGRGMLVHQGALSLEQWTGCAAPVAAMRAALDAALAGKMPATDAG